MDIARTVTADSGEAEGPPGGNLTFDKRRALLTVGLSLVLAGGAYALIGRVAHWGDLLDGLRRANRAWFPVLLLGEIFAYAGYVLAYRDVARVHGGPQLRYWTIIRVVAIGFGAFAVGSSAGSLAVDFWALRRAGVRTHQAVRRVLALNTLEWAWLAGFAAISGAIALGLRQAHAPLAMCIAWLVVVPACVLAAVWVSAPARGERLATSPEVGRGAGSRSRAARAAHWLLDKGRAAFAEAVGGLLIVRRILGNPLRYPAGFVGYPVYWTGDLLTLYAAARAFGYHVAPDLLILAYATGYVITAIPLPAGGAGGVDATLTFTLHLAGLPLAVSLLSVAVYRIFSFWLPIVPAIAFLPTVGAVQNDLRETAEAHSP
ncbi:MAG: lysylphosphatidylglycerol synthase transmembrane domain-containing protein [Gaiellaceae bacterium]